MFAKRCRLCLVATVYIFQAVPASAQGSAAEETVRLLVDTDGKQHVQIRGGSYFFDPDHIIVKVNVPVELSISREWGIVPHTFVMEIPETGVVIDESLGKDLKTMTLTPTVVGKFEFYCKNKFLIFKSHEEKGMKGILEVVE